MRPMPFPRAPGALLFAQVFLGGGAVMALELLGSRLLAPRFGSTLYVWGSLIGVVMAALALGAYVGGRRADRDPRLDALASVILVAGLLACAVPLAAPWALDLADAFGLVHGPLAATLLLLGPPTFFLGMATPFAVRLSAVGVGTVGRTTGLVTAASTGGSIVGTFATAFVLVPSFRVPALFTAVGVALVASALLGLRERVRVGAAAAAAILVVTPLGSSLLMEAVGAVEENLANRVLYETETPYHQIKVYESRFGADGERLRQLVMDGLRHSTTYTKRVNDTDSEYVYDFHLARVFNPNATSVLFVGAGGFSGPKQFLRAYPGMTIDVVEIDPEVVRVAAAWFFAPVDDPRVRVFTMDGRRFLQEADRRYDVVVLDAYSRTYIPFHLMTAEFFFELADVLNPGGVVLSNVIAALHGPASQILKAEAKTMHQAFAETYVFPVRGEGYPFAQNVILVATDERERTAPEALAERAAALAPSTVPDLEARARRLVPDFDTRGAPVLRDHLSPVEILLNPVTRLPYEGG